MASKGKNKNTKEVAETQENRGTFILWDKARSSQAGSALPVLLMLTWTTPDDKRRLLNLEYFPTQSTHFI